MTVPSRPSCDADRLIEERHLRRVQPRGWTNPTPQRCYDLAVVGAGPAGMAAVQAAIRRKLKVALIERHRLGGNSLNAGSIPSKAIIRSARAYAAVRAGDVFGAAVASEMAPDFPAVMRRMRSIRARIAEYQSIDRLCAAGVDVFLGDGRFSGPNTLLAADAQISFKKAIVATGARLQPAGIAGLEETGYFTSDSIFEITELPRRLGIIGGGPLGCELAQAFCRLGSRVDIVQNEPTFLPEEERDAAELLSLALSRDGVATRLNTTVTAARRETGAKALDTVNNEVKSAIAIDEILLSIGRIPDILSLDLDKAGIEGDSELGLKVDDFLCTSNPDVYAAGDVCSRYKFANVAEATGHMAIVNALGTEPQRQSHLMIPRCTFCDPEIARIGINLTEARERAISAKAYTIMIQDVDRAITDDQDHGFVKIYVKEGSDQILGATIVASGASEMINEMSVIMNAKIGMRQLSTILHSYPTQSDAIRLAARAFVRNAMTTQSQS